MGSRDQQEARRRVLCQCFDEVASFEYVKNKWIELNVWIQLIREYNRGRGNQLIANLDDITIEKILKRSHVLSHENVKKESANGYYYQYKRIGKRRRCKTQTLMIEGVLARTKGQLPPPLNQP